MCRIGWVPQQASAQGRIPLAARSTISSSVRSIDCRPCFCMIRSEGSPWSDLCSVRLAGWGSWTSRPRWSAMASKGCRQRMISETLRVRHLVDHALMDRAGSGEPQRDPEPFDGHLGGQGHVQVRRGALRVRGSEDRHQQDVSQGPRADAEERPTSE